MLLNVKPLIKKVTFLTKKARPLNSKNPVQIQVEVCRNPWKNPKCLATDIEVYIYYKKRKLPICKECWFEIADSDKEW